MTDIVSVFATFASTEEAERIGLQLVEERLAACVNILPEVRSIYRWQGAVETTTEAAAVLKTGADHAERLLQRLTELHSYENPAATVWPVQSAPPAYAAWVIEQLG